MTSLQKTLRAIYVSEDIIASKILHKNVKNKDISKVSLKNLSYLMETLGYPYDRAMITAEMRPFSKTDKMWVLTKEAVQQHCPAVEEQHFDETGFSEEHVRSLINPDKTLRPLIPTTVAHRSDLMKEIMDMSSIDVRWAKIAKVMRSH